MCTFLIVSFSLTPAPPRKPLSTSPAKPVSGASRLQRKPQQAASRLPAGGRAGGGGGGVQKAAGGGASASELRAAEEEIKRLNTQVGPHIWSSVRTLLCVPVWNRAPLCFVFVTSFLPRVLRCVPWLALLAPFSLASSVVFHGLHYWPLSPSRPPLCSVVFHGPFSLASSIVFHGLHYWPLSPLRPPLCSVACITAPFLPRVLRCVPWLALLAPFSHMLHRLESWRCQSRV